MSEQRILWGNIYSVYYVENGIIVRKKTDHTHTLYNLSAAETAVQDELREHGYDLPLSGISSFLRPFVGHSWEEVLAEAERRAQKEPEKKAV